MSDVVKTNPVEAPTVRNHEEIVARLNTIKSADYFGFQSSDLLGYLPWEKARAFLRSDANEGEWRAAFPLSSPPLKEALGYLPFAWEKANNCRGLSAARSLEHMKAWLWLAGYDALLLDEVFDDYNWYGKPQLVFTSTLVGFDWRKADDGIWRDGSSSEAKVLSDVGTATEVSRMVELAEKHKKE